MLPINFHNFWHIFTIGKWQLEDMAYS